MPSFVSTVRRVNVCLVVALLGACGGGGDDSAPAAPAPTGNQAPTAQFAAAASAQAGQAIAFDGAASSDPDGDALSFSWDFGDGIKGGGRAIAHRYAAAGSYTATLAVGDGQGHTATRAQTITVTASSAAPGPQAIVTGIVSNAAGGALAGVSAQLVGGAAGATSGSDGKLSLNLPTGVPLLLRLSKSGYVDQLVPIQMPSGAANSVFKSSLLGRESPQSIDAGSGGTLNGKQGAALTLVAGSLVDASGAPFNGTAQVSISPLDVSGAQVAAFPGSFQGLMPDGTATPIASYGTVEYALSANGQKLQIAPGRTAGVLIPIYASKNLDGSAVSVGQQIPLWSLDEASGHWVQEGFGTVVVAAASPSGLAMQATVSHLSWWNVDHSIAPPDPAFPKPRCYRFVGPEFPPIPQACSIGAPQPGEFSVGANVKAPAVAAANPRARAAGQRVLAAEASPAPPGVRPAYVVRADIPAEGGVALPIPANSDLTLFACSDAGTYCGSAVVHGAPGSSDEVAITLMPLVSGNCATPTAVALPSDTLQTISDAAVPACLTFTATAGQVVVAQVQGTLNSSLAANVKLFGPDDGVLIDTAFTAGISGAVKRRALQAGLHRIQVTASGNTSGGFKVSLQLPTSAPQVLSVPSGVIDVDVSGSGERYVTFPSSPTDTLAVSVRPKGSVGTIVSLSDEAMSKVTPGPNARDYGAFTFAPAAEHYHGFYTLQGQLGCCSPDWMVSVKPAQPVTAGTVVNDSLPAGYGVNPYTFDASAGDVLSVVALSNNTSNPIAPYVRLFDAAGEPLPYSEAALHRAGPYVATQTTHYRVDTLHDPTVAVPSYALRVVKLAAPTPVPLSSAVTSVSGSLNAIGDMRFYSINLAQGDLVRFTKSNGSPLVLTLDVLAPSTSLPFYARPLILDNRISSAGDSYTQTYLVPTSGEYIVRLAQADNSTTVAAGTGAFSWSVQRPSATALTASTLTPGTLAAPFGMARFRVDVATAGSYRFCSRSGGFIQSELRASDGSSLVLTVNRSSGNFNNPEFVQTLQPGSYTLDVSAREPGDLGFDTVWRPAADAHPPCL